jgi:hypothetical protein
VNGVFAGHTYVWLFFTELSSVWNYLWMFLL